MYKIVFFVPVEHCEVIKNALFKKGAGRFENYENCAWQVLGKGQFRPLEGSNPFFGTKDKIECVDEYRVEMICPAAILNDVLEELVKVHPYEEPAFEAYKVITKCD